MTTPLELHYRRLLAVYPAAHRRTYEEEMVAVLMEGAQPGRRRPTAGEVVDLLRAGLAARVARGVQQVRGPAWRDAAGVVGLIGVVTLTVVAGRRLLLGLRYYRDHADHMRFLGIDGGLLVDVAARSVAWFAVLVAVLLAARRTAVVLGIVALLVEIAAIVIWLPVQEFRIVEMSWAPVLALLTVALLVLSRGGRPAGAVLGRRGGLLLVAGLAGAGAVPVPSWDLPPQILGLVTVPQALLLAAGAALLGGLLRMPAGIRRRALVLLAPVLAVPVAQQAMEKAIGIHTAWSVTPGILVADVLLMTGIPVLAFALAAVALHLRETVTVTVSLSRAPRDAAGTPSA